jgi:hypothetical protein
MPRRRWRQLSPQTLAERFGAYPCPADCPVRPRMEQLLAVVTYDKLYEHRTNGGLIPLSRQMVNGPQMKALIGDFLHYTAEAMRNGALRNRYVLEQSYARDRGIFIGLALACLSDLCFNMEYIRRITDRRWSYCDQGPSPRVYYPYLGVCPYCIVRVARPIDAALGSISDPAAEDIEDRRRYFGNKIQSHHVGRIGERALTLLIDLLTTAHDPGALSGLVFDDQHDVDAIFFFSGIGVLAQIKASPLVAYPAVIELPERLTSGASAETGLPTSTPKHTFVDLATAGHSIGLYLPLTDKILGLGSKLNPQWPYAYFRERLTLDVVVELLESWFLIFRSFEIPKVLRDGEDIRRAWLTSGWGAPIDDNKTKAGLARSDNMMKGTYACLKYGAHYVLECQRRTLRTALISNIDPAHQYAEYLEKIQDVRWGHAVDFTLLREADSPSREIISSDRLAYLFDSVYTFNRQIVNDVTTAKVWNLDSFADKLIRGELGGLLTEWRTTPTEP